MHDKENVLHLMMEFYTIIRVMKLAGKWVELEKKIILSEVTQTRKEKYCYVFTYR